jgi:tRNA-dihydrouridine synthase A
MMDWTDRHARVLHRLLSRRALLYTEMVSTGAVIHGHREKLLGFDPIEHPVALQLGGSDPDDLARAAAIGAAEGYDEINLNCGCPSDRVQNGRFGACLMAEPTLVARLYAAMQASVGVPVTVKCRIGIDDQDAEADFRRFIDAVADAGCRTFIVHARKAWLKGLSPKENREIPPLDYDRVYRLKTERPELTIVINGGIGSLDEALAHLKHVDGVMLGRAAYQTPYILADADHRIFGETAPAGDRLDVVQRYRPYVAAQLARGIRLTTLVKPLMGLFHAEPGGKLFRRILSEEGARRDAGLDVIDKALDQVADAMSRRAA